MSLDNKVPAIRFDGFSGEWNGKNLSEIGSFTSGVGFSESEQHGKFGIPFFKVSDMNFVENNCYMVKANNYVNNEQISRLNYTPILENSILFAKVGAAIFLERKKIAKNFLIDNNMMAFSTAQNVIFIKQWFDSIRLSRYAQTGALPSLNASDLGAITLKIPELYEQAAIGNYFQKLDTLINQHQQKHDKLCNIKKAMLEKMFPKPGETTPEIRFKGFCGEWKRKKLGDITEITMGQSPSGENYTENPNDYILVQGNADLKNGFVVPRIWTSEITKIATKDALIFSVRAPVGEIGKTKYNVVLGRGVAAIYGNEFIYQQFKKLKSDNYWYTVSAGSTFDAISSLELSSTFIWISSESEQITIGNYFQKLDKLIDEHQQQISKLNNIKQACLSKMFV